LCHLIRNPEQLVKADLNLAGRFHRLLLGKGVFFTPALRGYVSAAHTADDIDITITSMEKAFQQL
jgi:glutamate-1-semialdehyde aminotransferase